MIELVLSLNWSMISKLLIAAVLGAIVGFERERSGKVAGLRTHALVCLGSALFTIMSLRVFEFPHMIANIVVGIGFIGAGAIMRKDDKVEGTTTAASLWAVAAIGIASGFGFFQEAIAATIIVYIILAGLWIFEKYFTREIRYRGEGIYGKLKNSEPGNTTSTDYLQDK